MRAKILLASSPECIKEVVFGSIHQPVAIGLGDAQPRNLLTCIKALESWRHDCRGDREWLARVPPDIRSKLDEVLRRIASRRYMDACSVNQARFQDLKDLTHGLTLDQDEPDRASWSLQYRSVEVQSPNQSEGTESCPGEPPVPPGNRDSIDIASTLSFALKVNAKPIAQS